MKMATMEAKEAMMSTNRRISFSSVVNPDLPWAESLLMRPNTVLSLRMMHISVNFELRLIISKSLPCLYDYTRARAVDDESTLQSDVLCLQEIGRSMLDFAINSIRLSSQDGPVNLEIGRHVEELKYNGRRKGTENVLSLAWRVAGPD